MLCISKLISPKSTPTLPFTTSQPEYFTQNLVFHTKGFRVQPAMFRSMSTRRGLYGRGYERLGKESATTALLHEELKRSTSLPSSRASNKSSRKMALGSTFGDIHLQRNPTTKGNNSNSNKKSHPLFNFLDFRRKKKTTARPEFARYLEYLKEGGMWDLNSNKPVIYYS